MADEINGGAGADRSGHEKNSKLMAQLDKMLKLLKQIDSVEVPANDFDSAWDRKVDVERNQYTNPTRVGVAVPSIRQVAVRGISKTDAATIEISLTSSAEKSAADQAEEAARKATLERQNALPVWHTQSTVTTEAGNVQPILNGASIDGSGVDVKPALKEEDQKSDMDALDEKVAAYYAEMAREREREDVSSPEDASSDEEEDEFEDVGVTISSTTSAVFDTTNVPNGSNGMLKRELESESGSSVPHTNVATPNIPSDEGPATKKVKFEPGVKKEEESDEDEEEFEDV